MEMQTWGTGTCSDSACSSVRSGGQMAQLIWRFQTGKAESLTLPNWNRNRAALGEEYRSYGSEREDD
ncbi:hypothetical protein TIFTF001_003005 [Ficus carica]|uniref:Uncharacterized protein n=1 Tax=Ficus carica TaxID=3494 RepID=A0AA88D9D4_FICCA|nr:hypothetical protein TIFTF001_003005 [Ficus carica]